MLPWRAPPGERQDPYRVWLSEIMLQQTTVKTVGPYYARFLARWPDLAALAAVPLDDVLKAWAGLGYYARARNLHACARAVVERHGGRFPASEQELLTLPGIGRYTAAAIAAIAFDVPATPIDGNVERVVARLHGIETPLPLGKPEIARHACALTPSRRPGDFAQAMMDLGATLCSPKTPACGLCPFDGSCIARAAGLAETLPRREPKREGALRRGAAFVVLRADGCVLIRQRPARGLLGGMTEVPNTEWSVDFDETKAIASAPRLGKPGRALAWRRRPGVVRHVFTHFPLELAVYVAKVQINKVQSGKVQSGTAQSGKIQSAKIQSASAPPPGMRWAKLTTLEDEALPSLMRKVVAHALETR